ncbi:hypothetical protein [Streptomyces antimycoticus]|uniref:hypothetical protein n=1 Tax=Streptomyces antimycoticus TaxID=68175 RepID=UPI000A3A3065|nr:hypothetical protein [Streptomyces antimycoticus]
MAAEHSRGHGEAMVLHGSDELAVHGTAKRRSSSSHTRSAVRGPRSAVRGQAVSTAPAYDNHFVSIVTIKDREITHWRDCRNPVAVFDAIDRPTPRE